MAKRPKKNDSPRSVSKRRQPSAAAHLSDSEWFGRLQPLSPSSRNDKLNQIKDIKQAARISELLRAHDGVQKRKMKIVNANRAENQKSTRQEWLPGKTIIKGYQITGYLSDWKTSGRVYKAKAPGDKEVAVKRVLIDEEVGKAEKKALAIVKQIKNHSNLVSLHQWWLTKENELIIVMDLAEKSLADLDLPIEPCQLLKYMKDAAKGLDCLKNKGLVHQDVKPANLFLFEDTVRVGDYGAVRSLNDPSATRIYTPPFGSSELLTKTYDQRSLAFTYWVLRTGRKPESSLDISVLAGTEAEIIGKAILVEPTGRWENCTAFVQALDDYFKTQTHIHSLELAMDNQDKRVQVNLTFPSEENRLDLLAFFENENNSNGFIGDGFCEFKLGETAGRLRRFELHRREDGFIYLETFPHITSEARGPIPKGCLKLFPNPPEECYDYWPKSGRRPPKFKLSFKVVDDCENAIKMTFQEERGENTSTLDLRISF